MNNAIHGKDSPSRPVEVQQIHEQSNNVTYAKGQVNKLGANQTMPSRPTNWGASQNAIYVKGKVVKVDVNKLSDKTIYVKGQSIKAKGQVNELDDKPKLSSRQRENQHG